MTHGRKKNWVIMCVKSFKKFVSSKLKKEGKMLKAPIITLAVAIGMIFSGCSNKNEALKNTLNQQDNTKAINMASLKGKPFYVTYETDGNGLKILEKQTKKIESTEINEISNFNKNKSKIKRGCILLNANISEICGDIKLKSRLNDLYTERGFNAYAALFSPLLVAADLLGPATHGDFDESVTLGTVAPKEINQELLQKYSKYVNNEIYNDYSNIIKNYKNAITIEDKKRYEEEYYKFVDLEKVLTKKLISKQEKNAKELSIDDQSAVNGLIKNTQANGSLKLNVKILLKPGNPYEIPVKYGIHRFKVHFDLLLKYRISGMGVSMVQSETISRSVTVSLSPNNKYSTIVDVDFGKFVQASQSKLILFSGGQQLIDTKVNIEFENE